MPPKFGRRAGEGQSKKDGSVDSATPQETNAAAFDSKRYLDVVVHKDDLRSLEDGVDEQTREQAAKKAAEEKEKLVKRVAEAPVGYVATMPKLAELDLSNVWSDFLSAVHHELDISALTASLSQQLDDEDVAWNPDMLLVQLTSDMLDAAEVGESGLPAPDPAALEAVGKARRRRNELLENADEMQVTTRDRRRRPGGEGEEQAASESPESHQKPEESSSRKSSETKKKSRERSPGKGGHPGARAAQPPESPTASPANPASRKK
ncbi:hypothetical protein C3747_181g32 [Trypanosoma cruzi]|uniref:Intraflagellar transport protein 43 n=2 Tax=Trypanosoma cruzi TaxID=5693 RepID=Q4D158_TRYCC|nr:hypothetical protein, conserved [Trypanosoma cruzi]EAN86257.1 hypothetical protein, conserved [Trypanosoma cruzi]PWV03007.1 hypothetical protein C3747_181g32 [Trypanosoma cruzi]RNC45577.1 hypothetical protein TcCL_NonESM04637 [Trypanosoma cruzi]|eukprot:XP_808108.1 hypothetical protein [Trypanosoma cruzi strain CL Brener]